MRVRDETEREGEGEGVKVTNNTLFTFEVTLHYSAIESPRVRTAKQNCRAATRRELFALCTRRLFSYPDMENCVSLMSHPEGTHSQSPSRHWKAVFGACHCVMFESSLVLIRLKAAKASLLSRFTSDGSVSLTL